MLIPVYCEESDLPLLATAWTLIRMSAFVAPTRSARNASHPVSPLPTIGGRVGYGASKAVPAAKAERRSWVPQRPLLPTIRPCKLLG